MNRLLSTRPRRRRGFSLLELLAVVTIMGILAYLIVPRIGAQGQSAKRNMCRQYKGDINAAIERYYFDHGVWPELNDIVSPEYYPNAIPLCPVTNSAYTLDDASHRISGHAH